MSKVVLKTLCVKIDKDLYDKLKIRASHMSYPNISFIVRIILREYFKHNDK